MTAAQRARRQVVRAARRQDREDRHARRFSRREAFRDLRSYGRSRRRIFEQWAGLITAQDYDAAEAMWVWVDMIDARTDRIAAYLNGYDYDEGVAL